VQNCLGNLSCQSRLNGMQSRRHTTLVVQKPQPPANESRETADLEFQKPPPLRHPHPEVAAVLAHSDNTRFAPAAQWRWCRQSVRVTENGSWPVSDVNEKRHSAQNSTAADLQENRLEYGWN
jgi:hypothetical protein